MSTNILMHPKPMLRHTSRVKPATVSITIALPADCITRTPGLYMQLQIDDECATRTQLVIFPMDNLDELEVAIKALRAVQK